MYEEDVATLNGYTESSVFAPAEGGTETALWPIREDVWANSTEQSVGNEFAGEEMWEDMTTETATQYENEDAAEHGGEYSSESLVPEYGHPEASPFGELAHEQGAQEDSVFEDVSAAWEDTSSEDTASEDTAFESIHEAREPAYEDTSLEETTHEETYEDTPIAESAAESAGYELTGYELTGYEDGSAESGADEFGAETYETVGGEYRLESALESPLESTAEYGTETSSEFNPEMLEWAGELLAEDWAAGGEASASTDSRFGIAEHLHEESGTTVPAGERTVAAHPLLRAHRGTQPDLVVRWNAMPRSTTAVDVVVHLHGYSAAGPRMRIQDKAAMSGVDFGSPSGGAGGKRRPVLGLIPRGNYFGGQSGAGYNFPGLVQPGAINTLVASGLDLLRMQTGVRAQLGRLILTGHSGGGAPLNAILRHTDPNEVHIFDGTYGDMANVTVWAKRRIARGTADSALRVLFRPNTGTAKHALAIAAAICPAVSASPNATRLHRLFRVEATSVDHNPMPRTYGGRLLANPAADLPGAVRRGCVHSSPAPSSGPASSPSVTRTPDRAAGIVKVTPYAKDGTHALPGAVALAAQWRRLTGRTAGTFNARNTSFGTRSLHSEGRAIDCHGHVSKPKEAAQAEAYIRWLMTNAVELQVSTIIWNRRIWSWPRRAQGWRSYMTKPNHNPHIDHFHIDLSWEGALHPSPLFSGGVPGLSGAGPTPAPAPPSAPSRPAPAPPSSGSATPSGTKRSPADFVRSFGPYAKASEAKTGVPGLVTLAQAAVESGWGARAAGNNFFGIKAKASDASGTRQLWRTREVLSRPDVRSFPEVISVTPRADGKYDYVVRDWFRVFPSPELAFVGHGEFLRRNKRYAPAFNVGGDPYRFAAEVARAGYATDPGYTKVVHSVMRLLERSGWR